MGLQQTSDGSFTFYSEKFGQTYHSVHGAKTESERVFIELGLTYALGTFQNPVNILEIGFGTGLNAFLTLSESEETKREINYLGVEAYPLSEDEYGKLPETHQALHRLEWGVWHTFNPYFNVLKQKTTLDEFDSKTPFHLIYFDAFSPEAQPELWTEEVFKKMYALLVPNGILTTYCSKSSVQKNVKAAGFYVEKHKGPPHKREVIRAIKK